MEQKVVFHCWLKPKANSVYAEFNVTKIINNISEHNLTYGEVETILVVWDPVGGSVYPILAPSITSLSKSSIVPSTKFDAKLFSIFCI